MRTTRTAVLILGALLSARPFAFGQNPAAVWTITPTFVSFFIGTDLYCAIRPIPPQQIQSYCFTTKAARWDTLLHNAIHSVPDVNHAVVDDYTIIDKGTWAMFIYKGNKAGQISWFAGASGDLKTGVF